MKLPQLAVNGLAVLGAVALLAVVYFWVLAGAIFGGTDQPVKGEDLLSPGGSFRATRITNSGGGAAGWCREFIIIRPSSEQPEAISYSDAQSELVFSARCDTEFTMSWVSQSQFLVRYRVAPVSLASFEVRATDRTQNVSVRVEPEA